MSTSSNLTLGYRKYIIQIHCIKSMINNTCEISCAEQKQCNIKLYKCKVIIEFKRRNAKKNDYPKRFCF